MRSALNVECVTSTVLRVVLSRGKMVFLRRISIIVRVVAFVPTSAGPLPSRWLRRVRLWENVKGWK
jgi:hypothetical protein